LVNRWVRELTQSDPQQLSELIEWGREAVNRIQRFYASDPYSIPDKSEARFSFIRPDEKLPAEHVSPVIGE
jgi:hypothetical protein